MTISRHLLSAALALSFAAPLAAEDAPRIPDAQLLNPGALTACLALNGGIMSSRRIKGGAGFDYRMLETIAADLGLDLTVTWFEQEQDEWAEPVPEAYAMLSLPLCDIVAAHPEAPGAFGPPPVPRSAPPRWVDKPDHWGHKQVDLKPVAITAPYMRAEQGIVLGPSVDREDVASLEDLRGLKLGIQQGTLGEAILVRQAPSEVIANSVTFNPGPTFLWEMENGQFEVTLTDVAAFDFHMRQNMISQLRLGSFRHELGLNIAFAVLEEHDALRAAVGWAVDRIIAEGRAAKIAKRERMTYAPPTDAPPVTPRSFIELTR